MKLRINLLPYRPARRLAKVNRLFMIWGVVGVVGIGMAFLVNLQVEAHIAERTAQKIAHEEHLKKLDQQLGEIAEIKAKRDLVRQRLELIAQLSRSRDLTLRVLDSVSQRIPEKAWLTRLMTKQSSLELTGRAQSNALVADFMSALERSPHLNHVDLTRVARPAKDQLEMKEFTVTAQITPPTPPEDPKAKPNAKKGEKP